LANCTKNKGLKNTLTYRSAISHLKKNYANPKSGVSFGGISRIYDYYNKVIPLEQIRKFLSNNDSYTLHAKSFKSNIIHPSFDIKDSKCRLI